MISATEIAKHARANGVPTSTIERDYAQNWFLKALYSKERGMVFKGGTAIRKTHINNYRFSDDLDFTMVSQVNDDRLKEVIRECIDFARDEANIDFEDRVVLEQNENGWVGKVYFRILRRAGAPIKIKLDVSKTENEILMTPSEQLPVFHNYSDEYNAIVDVYSLQETVAEKVRALFQRIRPRDLYDVYCLWEHVDKNGLQDIFMQKCKFKGITPQITYFNGKEKYYGAAWESSLRHQMKNLPDFDEALQGVLDILEKLGIE